ncbi:hypothetical protein NL676_022714 [Syzygium grande]|nr:hypothetical protein NL676_022714 [Syzygium grande]
MSEPPRDAAKEQNVKHTCSIPSEIVPSISLVFPKKMCELGARSSTQSSPKLNSALEILSSSVGEEDEQKPAAQYMNVSDGLGSSEATELARPRQQPSEHPRRFESSE